MRISPILLCIVLFVAIFSGGCAGPFAKLKNGGQVRTPNDPGTPGTVESGSTTTTTPLPTGSTVESTPATATAPAGVKVTLSAPSEMRTETRIEKANTGTVDTTVAVKRIETESAAAERRWLLWAAIGCGVAGLVVRSLLPAWPGLSNGLLAGAVAAGVAWKLAEVPAWLWLCFLAGAALLALGYKRAEWDKNGNLVPDFLEKK